MNVPPKSTNQNGDIINPILLNLVKTVILKTTKLRLGYHPPSIWSTCDKTQKVLQCNIIPGAKIGVKDSSILLSIYSFLHVHLPTSCYNKVRLLNKCRAKDELSCTELGTTIAQRLGLSVVHLVFWKDDYKAYFLTLTTAKFAPWFSPSTFHLHCEQTTQYGNKVSVLLCCSDFH